MKKTLLAKRNALLAYVRTSWGAGALSLVIIALAIRIIAPSLFWNIMSPVFNASNALASGSHTFLSSFSDSSSLTKQNEQLSNENVALANENKALQQKIADLTGLQSANTTSKVMGIVATVVSRPPQSPYDTLVVAAGSRAGVEQDMTAFGAGSVPLGVVTNVTHDYSQIVLYSSSGVNTPASVGGHNVPLTLVGTGGGTFSADMARSADIATGDTVYVPSAAMSPIGTVVRIDSDQSSPSVTLRIMSATNIFSVSTVELRATIPK